MSYNPISVWQFQINSYFLSMSYITVTYLIFDGKIRFLLLTTARMGSIVCMKDISHISMEDI